MPVDGPAAAAQHSDAFVDTIEHLAHGEGLEPRRGEFQRERKAVEATSEVVEIIEFVVLRCSAAHRRHPVDEQLDGRRIGTADVSQRPHRDEALTVDCEALAAGGQNDDVVGRFHQTFCDHRCSVEDVFTVVEHHATTLVAQHFHKPVDVVLI